MNKKLVGSFALLLAALIWGLGFSVQSVSANSFGSFSVVFFKSLGGILLIPVCLIAKEKFDSKAIIGGTLSGLAFLVANVFQQKGLEITSVGKASFLTALYIVFVPIIAIALKRKPSKYAIIGVFVAILGMYFLCIKGSFSIQLDDIYLLICAFFTALQIIIIDIFVKDTESPIMMAASQGCIQCLICGPLAFMNESITLALVKDNILLILYMCFLSCALAETLEINYQKYVNPTLASLLMSFESVFGALGGFILLNQILSIREIIGCILIFIAVLIAQK